MKEIKASDLRIGNLVNYRYYNPDPKAPDWAYEAVEIVEIKQSHLVFKHLNKKAKFKIGVLYAMPLTEEWLERFGFQKITKYEYCLKAIEYNDDFLKHTKELEIYATFDDNGFNLSLDNIRTESDGELECVSLCLKHILHVHTLQNLFYALCGEELTINN